MKTLFMSLIAAFSVSANALDAGKYTCSLTPIEKIDTDDKASSIVDLQPLTMTFEYDGADLVCPGTMDEDGYCDQEYFTIADPNYVALKDDESNLEEFKKNVYFSIPGMYADGGFGDTTSGNFYAQGDSDGCDGALLKLYKNSGFTKGTIESSYSCSGEYIDGTYKAEVACTIAK